MNHSFDVEVATKYGISIATFLNNIAHWTVVNIANRRNYHDGRYWIFNTRKAFTELFPYWTENQLRTISKNAKEFDLIIESNYNKHGYDKTIWYALTDKALSIYNINPTAPELPNRNDIVDNPHPDSFVKKHKSSPDSIVENDTQQIVCENNQKELNKNKNPLQPAPRLICEKSQMDLLNFTNGSVKNHRPIPNSNPDINPDTTTTLDQILNKDHFSEPVVVIKDSLTSTPKDKPKVIEEKNNIKESLIKIYRNNPFVTSEILCEEDFLSAAQFSIDDRGEVQIDRRIAGIAALVKLGKFTGEQAWITANKKKKDKAKGELQAKLIDKSMRNKSAKLLKIDESSPKDATTALSEIMKQLSIKNEKDLKHERDYATKMKDVKRPPCRPFLSPEYFKSQEENETNRQTN